MFRNNAIILQLGIGENVPIEMFIKFVYNFRIHSFVYVHSIHSFEFHIAHSQFIDFF